MPIIPNYPYTDMQTLNLDGLVQQTETNTTDIATVTASATENAVQIRQEVLARQRETASLQQQIDGIIAGTVQTQDRRYNVNDKRRILFVGDNHMDMTDGGYAYRAASLLGIPSNGRQILTRSGAGFHPASYSLAKTYANMLAGATLEIDSALITDVVFSGGAYDVGADASDIAGGINDACTWVHSNLPNARIWIMFACWRPDRTNNNDYLSTYTAYRTYAARNGATFDYLGIAIHSFGLLESNHFTPNTDGETALAIMLAQVLAGTPSLMYEAQPQAVAFTALAPLTSTTSNLILTRVLANTIYVSISGRLTFDGTTSVTMTSWFDIGNVSATRWSSGTTQPQSIDVPCMINTAGGQHYNGTAGFRIVGAKLQCVLRAVNPSTGVWVTATPVTTVQLLGGSASLDAVTN